MCVEVSKKGMWGKPDSAFQVTKSLKDKCSTYNMPTQDLKATVSFKLF